MRVRVKLYANLRKYAPEGSELGKPFEIDLDRPTILGLLERLGLDDDKAKSLHSDIESSIIMVNGNRVEDYTQRVNDGDLVVLFPPVGGG